MRNHLCQSFHYASHAHYLERDTPDNGEQFVIEMRGGTLTNIAGYTASNADVSITKNRSDLDQVIMGQATLPRTR